MNPYPVVILKIPWLEVIQAPLFLLPTRMKRAKGPRIRYGRKFDCGLVGKSIEEIQKIIEEKTAFFAAERASQALLDGENVDDGFNDYGPDDYGFDNFSPVNMEGNYSEDEYEENPVADSSQNRTYTEKVTSRVQQWARNFATYLFDNFLKSKTVAGKRCSVESCVESSAARCRTCVSSCWFCSDHAKTHCEDLFHILTKADGTYIGSENSSTSARSTNIVLISHGGWIFDELRNSKKILEEGIWFPLTPERPTVFVHLELMEAASQLYSGTMISSESIVKFVESFFSIPPPLKWRANFGEALKQYSALKIMVNHGKTATDFMNGQISCRTYCPACFASAEDTGTVIMTMDGAFSFKHYDGHATEIAAPILSRSVFFDAPDLNTPQNAPNDNCNEFRSGDIRRKQNEYCDISGIFGGICVHGIIFGLINIERGESLDYSLCMTSYVRQRAPKSRIIMAYDLFCKIASKDAFTSLADGGFIPAMHALNHIEDCRGEFDPSRLLGIGREDGEDSERGWSILNKMAAHTSVMRNENRQDVLSIAVDQYNDSMIFNLVDRIGDDLKNCVQSIRDILTRVPIISIKTYSSVTDELSLANRQLLNLYGSSDRRTDPTNKFLSEVKYFVRKIKSMRRQARKKGKTLKNKEIIDSIIFSRCFSHSRNPQIYF